MKKYTRLFFLFSFLFILFTSVATDQRRRIDWRFYADEASYFAIVQSLAHDLDLKYTRKDIVRLDHRFQRGPEGLFLKEGPDGTLSYAKSYMYPLFAAPFFKILGFQGLMFFNGLMVFLMILMGFLLLRRYHPEKKSLVLAGVFVLASVIPIYMSWITADLFNCFILFTGLFFFFYPFKRPGWFYLSAFFFAAAVYSKMVPIVPIAILYLILLLKKRWKTFLILSLVSVLFFSSFVLFYYTQSGDVNFMGGERRTFYQQFPFEKPGYGFRHGQKLSTDDYWERFYFTPRIAVTNLFYYIFGRFTGVFIYFFPAVFLLALFFFQHKEREDWVILAAIAAAILVYTVLAPDNYFGGSGSVGNRYFLSVFPLFFFLGHRRRIFKATVVPVLVAVVLLSSLFVHSMHRSNPAMYAGLTFPINLFPVEKTQFLNLPTNENPFAFHNFVRQGDRVYWVFFVNDNFWPIETTPAEKHSFWTYADRELEMLVAVPGKVSRFEIHLTNIPVANRVRVQVEYETQSVDLKPRETATLVFENIRTIRIDNRYIFSIRIKSDRAHCFFLNEPSSNDRRVVGVKTLLRPIY